MLLYKDVFEAVQTSSAAFGIVPFENSSNGSVIYTLDLFADRQTLFPSITVCDEAYLDIHHYLLGYAAPSVSPSSSASLKSTPNQTNDVAATSPATLSCNSSTQDQASSIRPIRPRAKALAPLSHITRIYSHPQAFGQCELFLRTYLPHASRLEVTSTSAAAARVSQDRAGTSAAISSLVAAGEHGLEILGEGIEDLEDNCTRFFILHRHDNDSPEAQVHDEVVDSVADHGIARYKTLVSFTIDHLLPGALADALMVFKTHGLNLTSINSRPSRVRPWHYIFFVEFEGTGGEPSVEGAFEELAGRVEAWRWLGSWRDRLKLM